MVIDKPKPKAITRLHRDTKPKFLRDSRRLYIISNDKFIIIGLPFFLGWSVGFGCLGKISVKQATHPSMRPPAPLLPPPLPVSKMLIEPSSP